jgi:hypothetical protein
LTYNVYRGTTPGAEGSTPIATGVRGTAFTDTGLTNGTTYYYRVSGANPSLTGGLSNEGAAAPQAASAFSTSINFSNNVAEVPTGYVNDTGLAFGNRGNGFRFGWNQDNASAARDRDDPRAPDERYDSFIHMQKPENPNAFWEIALPNGTYTVHVVAGEIGDNFDAVYAINVQDVLAVSGTPTATAKFFEGTVTVPVTNGLLTVSNGLGSMNNKIAFIDITQASADSVDFSGGFAGATRLWLNGGPVVSGTRLRLTDGNNNEARSVFLGLPVNVQAFTNDFSFQLTNPNADGFTFTLQGGGPAALGGAGGGLGYSGINQSVAMQYNLYNNVSQTGLGINGAINHPTNLATSGVNLHSGHVFNVHMAYDGATLTVTITDATTSATATQTYTVDIPGTVGGPLAYVGFTAGTGGATATQEVLTWTYTPVTGPGGGGEGGGASGFSSGDIQSDQSETVSPLIGLYHLARQQAWSDMNHGDSGGQRTSEPGTPPAEIGGPPSSLAQVAAVDAVWASEGENLAAPGHVSRVGADQVLGGEWGLDFAERL